MKNKILYCTVAAVGALLMSVTDGFTTNGRGNNVNSACAPVAPYTGDCTLCHVSNSNFGTNTPAMAAYNAGGTTLTNFFCPEPTPVDNDGDGFTVADDCNDNNAAINPDAVDIPNNGIDENCDGSDSVDTNLLDNDGDSFTPARGDCNDNNAAINPGATENCNDNIDNNCNDLIDDQDPAAVGCLVCTDNDQDTFFAEGGACGEADCDDANAAIKPGVVDIPNNGIDENCDGADSVDPSLMDNDGDGFTVAANDCDDTDAAINPNAFDIPNNGIDENCDGSDSIDTATMDNDGDGFTPAAGDCDDTEAAVNPDAVEICTDGIDNDCNNLVDTQDPGAIDCPQTCFDNDGDTYKIEGGECGPVDCDDNDASVSPGAEEICDDGIDNDCDGSIDEGCEVACPDVDGDSFQDAACGGTDCNDTNAAINPGSAEVCGNGIDENCNGASDDTCLTCPNGALLIIKEMEYNQGDEKLHIKGRATAGTFISIINSDTGKILDEGIRAREGKWEAEIKGVGGNLKNISVVSSNGCELDQEIKSDREEDDEEDDRRDRRRRTRR